MSVQWFYEQLGIGLGRPCGDEASARCFAAPEEHRREDREPSVSVNLTGGMWFCHGCGRGGGAYDAALAVGLSPRQAMELLRSAGLLDDAAPTGERSRRDKPRGCGASARAVAIRRFEVSERQVTAWCRALTAEPAAAMRVLGARGFSPVELAWWGVGWDGRRLTLPIRDGVGRLEGLVRYTPWPAAGAPKALAVRGSVRDLFPAPEQLAGTELVLCEGEPDALALLSCGVAAVAIPGVGTWHRAQPERLVGRRVTVALDCDPAGRAAAAMVHERLQEHGVCSRLVDLAPGREDGYDVSDALRADRAATLRLLVATR